MHRLVLIRHGESVWNRENRFTGWTGVDLSERGEREAADAGRALADAGYDFDVCHTSVLKRAIRTLWIVLDGMDRMWLPVVRDWRLNERHYGALQGLNKAEMAERHGEEQVRIWRRSYAVPPPPLDAADPRHPRHDRRYASVDPAELPGSESLADTVRRFLPSWERVIAPDVRAGRRVLIAAHGNSLRALVKHLDGMSDEEVVGLNIPTGIPLVYTLDDDLRASSARYDGASRLIETVDALGNRVTRTLDKNGNPTRVTAFEVSPEGLVPPEAFSAVYVFDQLDRLIRATDNAGQTTRFAYDSRDLLTVRSDGQGAPMADPLGLFPEARCPVIHTIAAVEPALARLQSVPGP